MVDFYIKYLRGLTQPRWSCSSRGPVHQTSVSKRETQAPSNNKHAHTLIFSLGPACKHTTMQNLSRPRGVGPK